MIQPERGLAAYHAANAIERIKRARDDRRDVARRHKVVDAQMQHRYVPSLTPDIRNIEGHYPGT